MICMSERWRSTARADLDDRVGDADDGGRRAVVDGELVQRRAVVVLSAREERVLPLGAVERRRKFAEAKRRAVSPATNIPAGL